MSFRIEEKLDIEKDKFNFFLDWLQQKKAKRIFSDRQISSIYFENNHFDLYNDSIEGIVPRKKIRIRSYNNENFFNNWHKIEYKFSSAEGRFKISKNLINANYLLKFGIHDNFYGLCKPKLAISYLRSYYYVSGFRVTIDKNIKYMKYLGKVSNISFSDSEIIVEIKNTNIKNSENLYENFPFLRKRFSKYCRGVESLKLQ